MAKTFVRISLATKFRILFATAVLAIIAVALGVPWYFTERLVADAAEQSALQVGRLGLREWTERHAVKPVPESLIAQHFTAEGGGRRGPNFVPLAAGPSVPRDPDERDAAEAFREDAARTMFVLTEEDPQGRRVYRVLQSVRSTVECAACHDGARAPAFQANQLVAMMDVTVPPPQGSMIWWTRGVFALGGLLGALLAYFCFAIITRQIVLSPVRRLGILADRVAEGDLSQRVEIATGDEFERIGRRFNEMLVAITSQQERLRQANRALDLRLGELAEANVSLYEANRIKSEFLANVSHELRTPLNSIIGFAELLAETDDAKRKRHAAHILSSARMLLGIINDLLDLARIEAGKIDLRVEKTPVSDLCETLGQLVRPLADKKHLELVVQVAADLPVVRTDPGKLRQVLYNLLSNAIKFTPAGGRVTFSAGNLAEAHSPLAVPSIALSVADTGPGIAAADQERIFEKFNRLDGAMTRETAGAGLGLAISRELTALLGGRITLESKPGHGATFTVILPVAAPDEAPTPERSPSGRG